MPRKKKKEGDTRLTLFVRVANVRGLELALDRFAGAGGIFLEGSIEPTGDYQRGDICWRDPIDLGTRILNFAISRPDYKIGVLTLSILADTRIKSDAESCSTLIAYLTLPVRMCPKDRRVDGWFTWTVEDCYLHLVTGKVRLHVSRDPEARAFSVERCHFNFPLLREWLGDHRLGGAERVSGKNLRLDNRLRTNPDKREQKVVTIDMEAEMAKLQGPTWNDAPLPRLLRAAIQTAVSTAPAVIWPHLGDELLLEAAIAAYHVPPRPVCAD